MPACRKLICESDSYEYVLHYDDLSYSLCLINKGAADSTILQNGWAVICVARLISLSPLVFFFLIITPLAELIPTLHK